MDKASKFRGLAHTGYVKHEKSPLLRVFLPFEVVLRNRIEACRFGCLLIDNKYNELVDKS